MPRSVLPLKGTSLEMGMLNSVENASSIRARPGPRSRSCRSTPGRAWSAGNEVLATLEPDVEALLVRRDDQQGGLPRADRRVLRARRRAAAALEGLRRRHRGAAMRWTRSSRGCGSGPSDRPQRSRCWAASPTPTPRSAPCCSWLGIEAHRGPARARHGAQGADPHRAPATAVLARGGGRLLELFGEAPQWGEIAAPVPVDARDDHGRGVHRPHRGRPAGAVHLRLRGGGGQVPALARRRRDPDRPALQRHRVQLPRRRPDRAADRLARRGRAPPAGRRVASDHGRLLPEQRLDPAPHARRSTRSPGTRPIGRCTSWEDAFERLLKEAGEP